MKVEGKLEWQGEVNLKVKMLRPFSDQEAHMAELEPSLLKGVYKLWGWFKIEKLEG